MTTSPPWIDPRVTEALNHPDEFPPVDQVSMPGDRVAVVVDAALLDDRRDVEVTNLLGSIAHRLIATTPRSINFILPAGKPSVAAGERLSETLQSINRGGVIIDVVVHDPDVRDTMAYVAADADANPVYFNREIVDADWVLPVTVVGGRVGTDGDIDGGTDDADARYDDDDQTADDPDDPIYPAMTDTATIDRPNPPSNDYGGPSDWLGIQLRIIVDVDDRGRISAVGAGVKPRPVR